MKCPCKECDQKGCGNYHDSCEPYQEWQKVRSRINRKRQEYHNANGLSRDHEMKYRRNLKAGVYK